MGVVNRRKRWRWKFWKRVLMAVLSVPLAVIALLSVIVLIRTLTVQEPDSSPPQLIDLKVLDVIEDGKRMERAERLAAALRIATVSHSMERQETTALLEFHQYLKQNFPAVHSSSVVTREVINTYSLLYTVQGSSPGKLPFLLASHLDVVPAEPEAWEVPPFSGEIYNNTYIYGRGAIDVKAGVLGILEALEYILKNGERPQRSFFIAFGHDEEVGGRKGAQHVMKFLKAHGIDRLDFVLDEGFAITTGLMPGAGNRPVAMVGITEKGSVTLELSVSGSPGHSSFPPSESPIGILAAALARLEENPQPSMFGQGPEIAMFEHAAPYVSFGYRLLYANMWLFSGVMSHVMEKTPLQNSFVRTTTAITMFHGGVKDNVIPAHATATVNHRIHPAQKVAEVIEYDKEVIADRRVKIKIKRSNEAHPVSPFGSNDVPYQLVATSIRQVFNDVVVTPAVLIANTDTRWYLSFTNNLFRFLPTVITKNDTSRYHGNNERISIENYHQAVNFYYRVIKNADILIGYVPSSTINNGGREL